MPIFRSFLRKCLDFEEPVRVISAEPHIIKREAVAIQTKYSGVGWGKFR
ncbi:MAG: hypothetical protein ACYCPR_06030 [Thermoplasmataceae archaeon]